MQYFEAFFLDGGRLIKSLYKKESFKKYLILLLKMTLINSWGNSFFPSQNHNNVTTWLEIAS